MRLTPPKNRRLADELYGQLLDQIVTRRFVPGDKLPTEGELCKLMQVSRPVVREAITRLQADGLVVTRRGSGTYVSRAPSDDIKRFVAPADFSRYMLSYEVRAVLEPEAARLAARRRTPQDVDRVYACCDELARTIEAGVPSQKQDLAFHLAVAAASQNELFARQLSGLGEELEGYMSVSLGLTAIGSAERRQMVLNEHEQIAEAISLGDDELAATYMKFHLAQARGRLTDATRQP